VVAGSSQKGLTRKAQRVSPYSFHAEMASEHSRQRDNDRADTSLDATAPGS